MLLKQILEELHLPTNGKFYLRLFLVIFIAAVTIYVSVTYVFIRLNVTMNDQISGTASYHQITPGRDDSKIISMGPISLIRRDSRAIRADVDSYSTVKQINAQPIWGFASTTINIYKDKNADKYSGNSIGCGTYDKAKDRLLSYRCGNPKNLVYYDRPTTNNKPWSNQLVSAMTSDSAPLFVVTPFKGGVVGFSRPDPKAESHGIVKPLFTIDTDGKRVEYNIPDNMENQSMDSSSIVADTNDSKSNSVLIATKSGGIYFATFDGNSVNYKHFVMPSNYNSTYDNLSCVLVSTKANCYYGESTIAVDGEEEAAYRKQNKGGHLLDIDFSTDQPKSNSIDIDNMPKIDRLIVTKQDELYELSDNNLYSIDQSGDIASANLIYTNVVAAGANDSLYFIRDNSVYKVDLSNNEAYKVFHSEKLRLSNLSVFDDAVFVDTFVVGSLRTQQMHTFRLNNEIHSSPEQQRLLDILPYEDNKMITSMDFNGDTIRVQIAATTISDKARLKTTYDQTDFNENQERVLSKLRELGINTSTMDIIMSR